MTDVQLKEIQAYLEKNKLECVYVNNPNGDYLFVDININGEEIRLKCIFPVSFPYTFPKVYILGEFYKKYKPLPHIQDIDRDGFICTFDSNIVYPNPNMPKEVTLECIKKAQSIILDGTSGKNYEEFRNELLDYWELDSSLTADLIFCPQSSPTELFSYMRNYKFLYLSDSKEKLLNYLFYTKGWRISCSEFTKALFLPINGKWYPPFPNNNGEIFNALREEKYYNAYVKYLKNNKQCHIIVFSQIVDDNTCLAGWIQERKPTPNGFRLNSIVPEYVYGFIHKNVEIKKFTVNQLGHKRLFARGGDGKVKENMKISISGCGSVGSHLASVLVDLGINEFILIDKEILTADNIARHYCGASSIREGKAFALKEELLKHFPDMSIEAISKDVFSVIKDNLMVFNSCDYNFVVVGNIPTENRFISLFNSGKIKKPVIILWVEPYLMGGHAIILQHKQPNVVDKLFDTSYQFKWNILSDGDKYTKRESGCGSTFLPYSAFEVHQFLNNIMDYINQNIFEKKNRQNYLISWCGRLNVARKNKMKLEPQWLSEGNRKLRVRILNDENLYDRSKNKTYNK
ncbi:ThiF family adenylyltransferase [Clostridium guangxiense]|uniref:ThiF family adenylyltransferase n=1 Tax=Clostridium guangxiense TaxID=1662055 RepID=UPI001E3C2F49|nr:ThiF family adenylyltransferase [Clostridium guangxiense]MCD2348881.1 ThiF family adenylyltransferase [Clostridium guangxiense]